MYQHYSGLFTSQMYINFAQKKTSKAGFVYNVRLQAILFIRCRYPLDSVDQYTGIRQQYHFSARWIFKRKLQIKRVIHRV